MGAKKRNIYVVAAKKELASLTKTFKALKTFLAKKEVAHGDETLLMKKLPWFLVIGPGNAGKSLLIQKSELEATEGAEDVIPSNKHCQAHITNEAVFLEGGNLFLAPKTTNNFSRRIWAGLLKCLWQARKQQALTGIMVVMDITTLSDDYLRRELPHIKNSLQDLCLKFSKDIPVYLVLTHLDKITGFNAYFDDLNLHERQQIWGMTRRLDEAQDLLPWFDENQKSLLSTLQERVVHCMHRERKLAKRSLIHQFPEHFDVASKKVKTLLTGLCTGTDVAFDLRGIYFVSAHQQGSEDHTLETSRSDIQVFDPSVPMMKEKHFFTYRLFRELIYREASIIHSQYQPGRLKKAARFGFMATAAASFAAATFYFASTFNRQVHQVSQAEHALTLYHSYTNNLSAEQANFQQAIPALEILKEAKDILSTQSNLFLNFAKNERLNAFSEKAYHHAVNSLYLPSLTNMVKNIMQNDPTRRAAALQIYMMLEKPEAMQKPFVRSWLEHYWAEVLPGFPNLQEQLNKELSNLIVSQYTPMPIDLSLLDSTQQKLLDEDRV